MHKAKEEVQQNEDYYMMKEEIYMGRGVEMYSVDCMRDNVDLKEHLVKKIHTKKEHLEQGEINCLS